MQIQLLLCLLLLCGHLCLSRLDLLVLLLLLLLLLGLSRLMLDLLLYVLGLLRLVMLVLLNGWNRRRKHWLLGHGHLLRLLVGLEQILGMVLFLVLLWQQVVCHFDRRCVVRKQSLQVVLDQTRVWGIARKVLISCGLGHHLAVVLLLGWIVVYAPHHLHHFISLLLLRLQVLLRVYSNLYSHT